MLARIRDNQRRSRARRKEYTRDLEERLRSFEKLGVAASQEVQEAGRKVAKENALLRTLLILRGVTEDEIEHFLKTQSHNTPTQASSTVATGLRDTVAPAVVSEPDPPARLAMTVYTGPESHGLEEGRLAALTSDSDQTVSQGLQHYGQSDPGQFTSCENAARIIAGFRNYPGLDELRSELGCETKSSCMVRNMAIFEALDK
ncbi:hypothetical protein BO78DRAFT_390355 [Aspergillus sclerotiicarbonarius CBS 121057]|uniref:BZIP domain-containing protein n=1 Tax=Aspergillus sclerotiicarbonarius (strain CBS 121057 / IBT 28362) TaxID=1448318 RepID=A0A319DWW8_ASPSB|nr:hypothetical protein BO78DRAFT_390355 [Aspergillus sclerotiicarbonarius CBS 121057]